MNQLVTGDAVVLDLRPARVPTRLLGSLIDLGLMAAATYAWTRLTQATGASEAFQTAMGIVGGIVILFGYPITMETLTRGRTLGKYALGLRVARDDGGAIRFRQALLRGLTFWAVDFAIWTGFCGGVVAAAVNTQSKRLGDLLAGTIVIRTRAPRAPRPLDPVPAGLATWAGQLELSRLSDDLATAARHFVQRAPGMSAYPRRHVGQELARKVAAVTTPAPPVVLEPVDYLAAVVAERRRRARDRLHGSGVWVPTAEELPAGWR